MARVVMRMPDVGEGVVEAEIVAWHVAAGDTVREEQPIVDVMTNKATVEITAPVAGVVVSVHGAPGDRLRIGSPLIEFETAGDAVAPAASATASEPAPAPPEIGTHETVSTAVPSAHREPGARDVVLAPPTVRRRAREAHVDLAQVPGSGPGGRVTHADLDRFINSGGGGAARIEHARAGGLAADGAVAGTRSVRIIGARRAIAEKMALSKRRIPHYSYVEEVDVTALRDLIAHLNARGGDRVPLGYLPFVVLALVRALPAFPHCNAHFDDEAGVLTEYDAVHVGVAVSTDDGLRVPVLRDAQTLSVGGIAAGVARLAAAARDGSIGARELGGSTITVTSLGKLGGIASTPVINHPEVAIIAVNRAVERPVVRHGAIMARVMMNLSASFDHRIVDGHDGASLVQAMKALLEHPATLFMRLDD